MTEASATLLSTCSLRARLRTAFSLWLDRWEFDFFTTLTCEAATPPPETMRRLLRSWDARVSRALVGPRWQRNVADRPFNFAFIEGVGTHPHWHILTLIPVPDRREQRDVMLNGFPLVAISAWQDLLADTGTADVRRITPGPLRDYVTKQLDRDIAFENVVLPDAFVPR